MSLFRRIGIALGSAVAASLVMWLVGGTVLSLFGLSTSTTSGQILFFGGAGLTFVTMVLGALIYRDIIRRERPGG
jgi:hypothetical protein